MYSVGELVRVFKLAVLILPLVIVPVFAKELCVSAEVTTEDGTPVENMTVYGFLTNDCFLDDRTKILCVWPREGIEREYCKGSTFNMDLCSEIIQATCQTDSHGRCELCFNEGRCLNRFRLSCRVIVVANAFPVPVWKFGDVISLVGAQESDYYLPGSGPPEQAQQVQGNFEEDRSVVEGRNFELKVRKKPDPVCGDSNCERYENSDNCCDDCGCPESLVCKDNQCVEPICGDGNCDGGENTDNCCLDCGCRDTLICVDNQCISPVIHALPENLTADALILVSESKLDMKYGQEGFKSIISKLVELKDTIEFHDNLKTEIISIDDDSKLENYGLTQADLLNPEKVDRIVEGLVENTRAKYIILVGGGDVIPFKEMSFDLDNDTIQTDDIYMDLENDGSYDVVVGRFPDGVGDTDPKILLEEIDSAISAHSLVFSPTQGFLVTAKFWAQSAYQLQNQLPYSLDLYESPTFSYFTQFLNYGNYLITPFHLYDIHGNKGGYQVFVGDGRSSLNESAEYPFVLSPRVVSVHRHFTRSNPAIVSATSCYGANIMRTSSESIPITFLREGAIGFVGSTGICYTGLDNIGGCKYIISSFIDNLDGNRVGDAFIHAKRTAPSRIHPRLRNKIKTEYVLYGDPTIMVRRVNNES